MAETTVSPTIEERVAAYKQHQREYADGVRQRIDHPGLLEDALWIGTGALALAIESQGIVGLDNWRAKKKTGPGGYESDWTQCCNEASLLVRATCPARGSYLNIARCARMALFVREMKPTVPNIERLSFHQIDEFFLPYLEMNTGTMTGNIRKGWLLFLTETCNAQLGDHPLDMRKLREAIDSHEKQLAKSADPKTQDELNAAATRKARREVNTAFVHAVDKALSADAKMSVDDIRDSVNHGLKAHGKELPTPAPIEVVREVVKTVKEEVLVEVGCDPTKCTQADLATFVQAMYALGRFDEIEYLAKLTAKTVEHINGLKAAKAVQDKAKAV
jgi:hypothetical protein